MIAAASFLFGVGSEEEVEALARVLTAPDRRRPVVVVSTRGGSEETMISAAEIAARLGAEAHVRLIRTGPLTYLLSDLLDDVGVYGGAARVYPPGTAWLADWLRAPTHLAYTRGQGAAAVDVIVEEVRAGVPRQSLAAARVPARPVSEAEEGLLRGAESAAGAGARFGAAIAARIAEAARGAYAEDLALAEPLAADEEPAEFAEPAPAAAEFAPRPLPGPGPRIAAEESPLVEELRRQLLDARAEIERLEERNAMAYRQAQVQLRRLEDRVTNQAAQLRARAAAERAPAVAAEVLDTAWRPDLFAAAEDAVRHAVAATWAERIPSYDKARWPLPAYAVGPAFAASLAPLTEGLRRRALRAAVDIITGLGWDMPARAVHTLSAGGESTGASLVRADGAVAFRAYVEAKAPAARRLHFWRLPDGGIELARVVLHDDYGI